MLTQKELLKIYSGFNDDEIVVLATYESKKLTEIAVPILIDELTKRNLGKDLLDWVNMERNFFKGTELEVLKSKIKNSICSDCKTLKNDVRGFFIHHCSLTHNPSEAKLILCESCGKKLRRKNYIISATFGWLSLRSFIKVPLYFLGEIFYSFARKTQSRKIIEEFIFENTGLIRKLGIDRINEVITTNNRYQLSLKRDNRDYIFEFF
ncbi:hypothetical protein [Epilithonimonas sp.]|uniref:hypothetical protein n=1 Tax=Epilithonimonas sp. TaxID=2894511 RepID=UPI0028A2B0A6|nr:hypothetical protein [Epilithonimonas sp.]